MTIVTLIIRSGFQLLNSTQSSFSLLFRKHSRQYVDAGAVGDEVNVLSHRQYTSHRLDTINSTGTRCYNITSWLR